MNLETVIGPLARLASLPYQERYIVGGTADNYLLPEDLLNDVNALKYRVDRPENRHLLNAAQRQALENLFRYIDEHCDTALGAETREAFIHDLLHGAVWKEFRSKAGVALSLFGLPRNLTVEDVERIRG